MIAIRNQLIKEEKHYLEFVEREFNKPLDKIVIPTYKEKLVTKKLRKLSTVHPSNINEYNISKKSNS